MRIDFSACILASSYTQINLFVILLNQPKIRLYLLFSDRFEAKRSSVWFQINREMVNTIWFQVDLIRFRKKLSVCVLCIIRDSWSFCYPRRSLSSPLVTRLLFYWIDHAYINRMLLTSCRILFYFVFLWLFENCQIWILDDYLLLLMTLLSPCSFRL